MIRVGALVVCAVFLAGCPEAPAPLPGNAPEVPELSKVAQAQVATLVTKEGRVDLERNGLTSKAAPGPLFENDMVATGPESSALLRDSVGRELELGEDTRFKVGAELAAVEVLTGEIAFLSDDDGGAGWNGVSVRTPYGVARLSGGATGNLRFVDGGLTGRVTFGTFEFEIPDAGTRSAKAGETFGVAFGEFEFDAPPVAPAPAVDSMTLWVEAGKPRLKRPTETRFSLAKEKESVPAGTAFQLPPGAAARLQGRNVHAVLAAGSSGVAEGERIEGSENIVGLSKVVGNLTLQFSGKGPTAVDLGDVKIGGGSESSVTVTQVGKKKRVEVKAGEVAVTVKGVATTLKAGDAVLADAGGAVSVPATRPSLFVNAAPRIRVYADGMKELALLLPDETNRVQVAREADFVSPIITGNVGKQVMVPLTSRAPLHYRVIDGQGQPTKQGRIDFLADFSSSRDTATRTDTVTETGQRATVFYQSKVPALTFQFASQPDVTAWRFRLYAADQLSTALIDKRATDARLVLDPGVLKEGEFLWSATALDKNGAEKAGTRMNKLSVIYDNARSSLQIDRPLAGERATADTVASGVAPRSAQLFINGKLVRPGDNGRFSVSVGAVDQVIFRILTGETESWWVRRLKR
jgi:hypothetical protein